MASDCPEIDSLIDHRIDQLIKESFTSSQNAPSPMLGQVAVLFGVKDLSKSKKKSGWFGHVKEQVSDDMPIWEKWYLNVKCLPISSDPGTLSEGDGIMNNAERLLQLSAASFESNLLQTLDIVDRHRSHIPPILTLDVAPFPYFITVSPSKAVKTEDETWGHLIKKMMD